MLRGSLAIAVVLLITACSHTPKKFSEEEMRLTEALIGRWSMIDQAPKGVMVTDLLQFFKNGDVRKTMVLEMSDGTRNQYDFSGTYEIVGDGKIRLDFGNQWGNRVSQIRLSRDELVLTDSKGNFVKYARDKDEIPY